MEALINTIRNLYLYCQLHELLSLYFPYRDRHDTALFRIFQKNHALFIIVIAMQTVEEKAEFLFAKATE